jgi:hypothetical protein
MSAAKHTSEPWTVGEDTAEQEHYYLFCNITAHDGRDLPVAFVPHDKYDDDGDVVMDTARANGARIVACVNALAGLNPEAVAGLVAAADVAQAELITLAPRLTGRYADNVMTAYSTLTAALYALRGGK